MELADQLDPNRAILILNIPKKFSWKKIKRILQKHAQEDVCVNLIPQDCFDILEVYCLTANGYDRLIQIPCECLLQETANIRVYPLITVQDSCFLGDEKSIFALNYDCIRAIFECCSTKDQIAIAKVCRRFYEIIRDMWCGKARSFQYNPYKMEFDENLTADNVREIFAIVGSTVETLRYNTIFFFPMIQRHLSHYSGNMVNLARNFVNANICRNLMYLENVQVFEVEGKFITDFTIRELARYCKLLRTFRLLDPDVRFLRGYFFPLFSNLEELYIRDCKTFSKTSLINTCQATDIKCLDIVDCSYLEEAEFVQNVCKLAPNLEVLKLTAQTNVPMLMTILQLTKLKELQFQWIARKPLDFELMLLDALAESRAESLQSLKFENEGISIDNQSMQTEQSVEKCALMRETTTLGGKVWSLETSIKRVLKHLEKFTSLKEITFEYCRPFTFQSLLDISVTCPSLRRIRMVGCSSKADDEALKKFKSAQKNIKSAQDCCELRFEAVISADQLEQLKLSMVAFRSGVYLTPTFRSIECSFA